MKNKQLDQGLAYCIHCRLLLSHCICERRPKLHGDTVWRLLTHPSEAYKRTNSGFHVKQLLKTQASLVAWDRTSSAMAEQCCSETGMPPVLLFPEQFAASGARVHHCYDPDWRGRPLIILDATWQQARKMYRQSPWLQSLEVWDLSSSLSGVDHDFEYGLRKNQQTQGCSTIETVATVMSVLGQSDQAQSMLSYFDLFQKDSNDPSQAH